MTTTVKFEGYLDREHVILTVSDGETHTSNLSKVYTVQCLHAEDADGYINATISSDGRTITFNTSAGADKKIYVTMYGRK